MRSAGCAAAVRRRSTLDVLHRQEGFALGVTEVMNPADVRVRDLARDAHVVVESCQRRRVGRRRCRQELQGDRLPERQVIGAIHLAHSTAAEEPDDAVTTGEDGARGSGRAVWR